MPDQESCVGLSGVRRPRSAHKEGITLVNWLVKEEPTHYGFDALVKDKKAVWSGVRNALAQKHLRAIKKGDRIFYYHTGDERRSEEHTSELQSRFDLVCRLLLEKKKKKKKKTKT